jgi:dTDP-4-amino-4,6-dideoxygalactose transaminase
MSEPIWLGPRPPSRTEWREMQETFGSSPGGYHLLEERVEARVAGIVERPFGVSFGSTGDAIEAALDALGVTIGTEVVVPALAPAALGVAIARSGARIRYADVDAKSLTLRAPAASSHVGSATRVIVGVAAHGQPAGLDELAALAARNELPLLEIVTGGLGGRIGRDPVGRFGRISVIGLGTHESPIGSGGAICVTNDDTLANALRLIRNLGRSEPKSDWERIGGVRPLERLGLDARMNPMQAALADVRLRRFDETCERLEQVFHAYLRRLAMHPDLVLPAPCADGTVCWSHFAVRLSERFGRDDRDSILQGLLRHDIAATSVLYVLPLEPAFAHTATNADCRIAQRAADRLIALPFSTSLTERDIDLICQTLQVMVERQTILR